MRRVKQHNKAWENEWKAGPEGSGLTSANPVLHVEDLIRCEMAGLNLGRNCSINKWRAFSLIQ